jgi:hypothetical protein
MRNLNEVLFETPIASIYRKPENIHIHFLITGNRGFFIYDQENKKQLTGYYPAIFYTLGLVIMTDLKAKFHNLKL